MELQQLLRLSAGIAGAYLTILFLGIVFWTYRDIRSRTRDGLIQFFNVAIVFLFNIPGLFIYLLLRPRDTLDESYGRSLEAEALMKELEEERSCPTCKRRVSEDFLVCPSCRTALKTPCPHCGRAMNPHWVACPYCGQDVAAARLPARQAPPQIPRTEEARL